MPSSFTLPVHPSCYTPPDTAPCHSRPAVRPFLSVPVPGDVARKYITDPELLRFIDLECFIWSTVSADLTPMINAGMVFCDRHFGGINYPVGGVGQIAEQMAAGELGIVVALWDVKRRCRVATSTQPS